MLHPDNFVTPAADGHRLNSTLASRGPRPCNLHHRLSSVRCPQGQPIATRRDDQITETSVCGVDLDALAARFFVVATRDAPNRLSQITLKFAARLRGSLPHHVHEHPGAYLCVSKLSIEISVVWIGCDPHLEGQRRSQRLRPCGQPGQTYLNCACCVGRVHGARTWHQHGVLRWHWQRAPVELRHQLAECSVRGRGLHGHRGLRHPSMHSAQFITPRQIRCHPRQSCCRRRCLRARTRRLARLHLDPAVTQGSPGPTVVW